MTLTHHFVTPPSGGVRFFAIGAIAGLCLLLAACSVDTSSDPAQQESAMSDAASTSSAGPNNDKAPASGLTSISVIQGSGNQSPLTGQMVTVRGVVNGNFVRGLGGAFIQSRSDEGDARHGLYLQPPEDDEQPALHRGDLVEVSGRVSEMGRPPASLTSLEDARWRVVSSGHPVPALLLEGPPSSWEPLEGLRVRIDAPLTVIDNGGLLKYAELAVAFGGRVFQPTELARPGAQAAAIASDNERRALLLDDNRNRQFPDRIWYLDPPMDAAHPLRSGSVISGVSGVIDQRHGRYRLQLDDAPQSVIQAPRPSAPTPPPASAGTRLVAAFNVLSLFNGDGRGGGFPTARGASSVDEYQRQVAKLVSAINAVKPDVLALMELENDGGGAHSSQTDLVSALNRALIADGEAGDYRAAHSGIGPGIDVIRVALLYRSSRVTAVGSAVSIDDGPFRERSRAPLAQAFRVADEPPFVVAVNHFKSKGGCDEADGPNADAGDGQGCWNAIRVESSQRLTQWLATDPTHSGSDRALIVGDLNAYSQEDPLIALGQAGFQPVFEADTAEPDYSFVWSGSAGRLDHALASSALAPLVTAAVHWHINADESDAFDYQTEHRDAATDSARYRADPFRSSDHDPLLVWLRLD